ncbi:MAG: type I-E CRISPR-associated protein Cas5/CasD [Armatimonadetes bacterium]|nr:type I-E CRISPR-associated protein Cas5/CasD [Armatimonadota bacterium]
MTPRHTLLMPLSGPMQSWGYRSRFDDRDTGQEPTRSGVIGLLCAALGVPRSDNEWLRRLDAALRMGVRVDAPGRVMVDYHTAQNVMIAKGDGATNVQSWRYYLADARFMVGLESEDRALLEEMEKALRHPVWTLALGRKSFPLSEPPHLPGGSLRPDTPLLDALKASPWRSQWPRHAPDLPLRYVIESDDPEPAGIPRTLNDRPLDFEARRFALRHVRIMDFDDMPPLMEE